jgi:hypothetical protein
LLAKRRLRRHIPLTGKFGDREVRHAPHHRAFLVAARDQQSIGVVARFLPNVLTMRVAVIEGVLKSNAARYDVVWLMSFERIAEAKAPGFGT